MGTYEIEDPTKTRAGSSIPDVISSTMGTTFVKSSLIHSSMIA